jgi:hypothetical protein
MNEVLEVDLMKKFPPAYPSEREVVEGRPLRVLDVRGFTLAWYLPDAISETVQVNSTAFLFSCGTYLSFIRTVLYVHWPILGPT